MSEGRIPLRWPPSSSRRSPWRGGSSPPSGLRVCTSSYVFDLSLSRVLEMAWSWCIASFAILVGSSSPPLLSCNGLSFPFEVILSDWVFKDLRTLDVCLARVYLWWQWDIMWSTWCMFWWWTCGFCDLGNLCIGVGTRFRLDSPVETLGHSLKFYVLVEYMFLRLCDAYRIIMPMDTWGDNGVSRWH